MFFGDGIRLATWHRDRLGCFETFEEVLRGEEEFFPITRPEPHCISCAMNGNGSPVKVYANVTASPHGPLTVEALDEQFRLLAGFSGDDCVPLVDDGLRQPVVWRDGDALPGDGGPFRLRVNYGGGMRPEDARLYALYVTEEG